MNRALSEVTVPQEQVAKVEEAVEIRLHKLDLRVVDRPGVMVGVCQIFASLNVNIDTLELITEGCLPNEGAITITCRTDPRTCDLAVRKLERLLDVLQVTAV
jgi:acetolactate synthase small subunit